MGDPLKMRTVAVGLIEKGWTKRRPCIRASGAYIVVVWAVLRIGNLLRCSLEVIAFVLSNIAKHRKYTMRMADRGIVLILAVFALSCACFLPESGTLVASVATRTVAALLGATPKLKRAAHLKMSASVHTTMPSTNSSCLSIAVVVA